MILHQLTKATSSSSSLLLLLKCCKTHEISSSQEQEQQQERRGSQIAAEESSLITTDSLSVSSTSSSDGRTTMAFPKTQISALKIKTQQESCLATTTTTANHEKVVQQDSKSRTRVQSSVRFDRVTVHVHLFALAGLESIPIGLNHHSNNNGLDKEAPFFRLGSWIQTYEYSIMLDDQENVYASYTHERRRQRPCLVALLKKNPSSSSSVALTKLNVFEREKRLQRAGVTLSDIQASVDEFNKIRRREQMAQVQRIMMKSQQQQRRRRLQHGTKGGRKRLSLIKSR